MNRERLKHDRKLIVRKLAPSCPGNPIWRTLFAAVRDMHCMSVVGVSNLGKSALLRSLTDAIDAAEVPGA